MNEDKLASLAKSIERFHRKIGWIILIALIFVWYFLRVNFQAIADSVSLCAAVGTVVCK